MDNYVYILQLTIINQKIKCKKRIIFVLYVYVIIMTIIYEHVSMNYCFRQIIFPIFFAFYLWRVRKKVEHLYHRYVTLRYFSSSVYFQKHKTHALQYIECVFIRCYTLIHYTGAST